MLSDLLQALANPNPTTRNEYGGDKLDEFLKLPVGEQLQLIEREWKTLNPQEMAEFLPAIAHELKQPFIPSSGAQERAFNSEADELLYGGAAGGGKLLPLDTPLPTPHGWIAMGDVGLGTTLFDQGGAVCAVTKLFEVEPSPELYRLRFDDGSAIDCCSDHLWLTYDAKEMAAMTRRDPAWRARRRGKRPSRAIGLRSAVFTEAITHRNGMRPPAAMPAPQGTVRTTREIVASLTVGNSRRCNHAIPVAGALQLPSVDLPVDPYVLGAWLGDGTARSGGFTNIDAEICQHIEDAGFVVKHRRDDKSHYILGLAPLLRKLGILSSKHIPAIYLRSSAEQRKALLQGLMDTDGTVARNSGAAEFCNTNRSLVDGVYELICSLGWRVRKREGRARLNGKDCGPKWTLKWVASEYVFRLSRKRSLQRLSQRRTTLFRYIKEALRIAGRPGRCIQVDSPSRLYLAGRQMVPTHNSLVLLGIAVSNHNRSLLLRRQSTELDGLEDDLIKMLGRDGYNRTDREHHYQGRSIKLGGMQQPDDWTQYAGRARDLIAFDEAGEFLESQVTSLLSWLRTDKPGQRTRVVFASNPPRGAEGQWLCEWFSPWIEPTSDNPAKDGELRWCVTPKGHTRWVDGPGTYEIDGESYTAKSRTFIRARLQDNPFLSRDNTYLAQLQNRPEPLRSQLLHGDFLAGRTDDAWQVIPAAWIQEARQRWTPNRPEMPMTTLGVDVAQRGNDRTALAARYGNWFAPIRTASGSDTPDGLSVATLAFAAMRDGCTVVVDLGGGWGGDAYGHMSRHMPEDALIPYMGINPTRHLSTNGHEKFANVRAWAWWKFREALDPALDPQIQLPPDPELAAELAMPRRVPERNTILIESKQQIIHRLGRSPDKADAVVMAWAYGSERASARLSPIRLQTRQNVGYASAKRRRR